LAALNLQGHVRLLACALLAAFCFVPLPLTTFKMFRASLAEQCQERVGALSAGLESDTLSMSSKDELNSWQWSTLQWLLSFC
jgi:hypothetical protein